MKKKTSKIKAKSTVSLGHGARSSGENLHVVPRVDGWVVRREGRSRPSSIHSSQSEAIEEARKIAKESSGQLVIHGRDGRIRERDSYGSAPMPPKDRRVLYPSTKPNTNREAIKKAVNEAIAAKLSWDIRDLPFSDFSWAVAEWIATNPMPKPQRRGR